MRVAIFIVAVLLAGGIGYIASQGIHVQVQPQINGNMQPQIQIQRPPKQKLLLPAHDEVLEIRRRNGKIIRINRHVPAREIEVNNSN